MQFQNIILFQLFVLTFNILKAYLERFLNEGVDEMDNPQEKEEKCIPGGCKRKMCLNGTFTIIYYTVLLYF